MRVLHIQKATGIGGSERHLLTLLPALANSGIEVRMCILAGGDFQLFTQPMKQRGIDTVITGAGWDVNPLLLARIRREIRRFRPDLVHTHLMHGDFYGQMAARLSGVPAVSSVHGTTHSVYQRRLYRSAGRLAGHLARRTIAISHHVQRFIENLGLAPADRVRTIHYGIDPSGWLLSEGERARAREDLGLAPHEVAVGVASRLVPDKGHGFLFDAISEALSKEPELRLLVAGGGPLRGSLESYARSHLPPEAFRFLGHVTDIRGFMNACDVVAFPSLPGFGEGFGLAALEAMAAAKPVVASAIDSLPEIVMDGETGFLVPPGKTSELGEKLATLASNPGLREELGGRGHQRAASSFTVEAMVNKTLRVYREIVQ